MFAACHFGQGFDSPRLQFLKLFQNHRVVEPQRGSTSRETILNRSARQSPRLFFFIIESGYTFLYLYQFSIKLKSFIKEILVPKD